MAISLVENGKKKEGFIDFTPYFNKIKHKLVWCGGSDCRRGGIIYSDAFYVF